MVQDLFEEREILFEISTLTYHPVTVDTYSDRPAYDLEYLTEDISIKGLIKAVIISNRLEVLDGVMRIEAYKKLGITHILGKMKNILEIDIPDFILSANMSRTKTDVERMNETFIVYTKLQRHQGIKTVGEKLTPKEEAIKQTGAEFSPRTFQKYIDVIKMDEKHPQAGLLKQFKLGKISITKAEKKGKEIEERINQKENQKIPKILLPPVKFDGNGLYNKSNWDMSEINNGSMDLGVASHPYWRQRTYGDDPNEMGREPTVEKHLDNLRKTYGELYKKIKTEGSVFVNMADSYGIMEHNLVPERFVLMMAELGYHKVKTCIWVKTCTNLIGNINRRPGTSYEQFYWFVKDKNYYYTPIQIPHNRIIELKVKGGGRKNQDGTTTDAKALVTKAYDTFTDVINQTHFLDVITTNTAANESRLLNKYYGEHAAMFPVALPLLPILQCCPIGGSVIDPFMGSASTLVAGLLMGRKVYGYETEPKYFEISKARLADVAKELDLLRAENVENEFNYKYNQAA